MNGLIDRLFNPDVTRDGGDPVASAVVAAEGTEVLEGTIDDAGVDIRVAKSYKSDEGDEEWKVRAYCPDRHGEMVTTKSYDDEFSADAVMEKLERDYNLRHVSVEKEDL